MCIIQLWIGVQSVPIWDYHFLIITPIERNIINIGCLE